jgi:ferredoxin
LAGFFDPFAILPRATTINVFPSLRSVFEKKTPRKTPRSLLNSNTEASTSATPNASSSETNSGVIPSSTSGEEIRAGSESEAPASRNNLRVENQSRGENSSYPPENNSSTGGASSSNPYDGAPDRRSLRRGGASEQQENASEANPYGSAPDRRSLRNQRSTNAGSSYESAPDRRSVREEESRQSAPEASNPDRRSLRRKSTSAGSSEVKESFVVRARKWILEKTIFYKDKRYYSYYALNGIFILIIIGLNFVRTRFWCRYLCGLGALYGAVGKYSVMRISQNDKCTNCGACAKFCQGACNPDIKGDFKSSECIYCFNCLKNCKFDALDISFSYTLPEEKAPKQIDLDKRSVIGAVGAGVASMFLFKTSFNGKRVNPALIRPPGALNETDFLAKCIKCGNCMRSCPNNFLQPTLMEAGLIGMFTPTGIAKKGFCSPSCTICTHACPTGAIRYLTEKDRGTDINGLPKMKIGTASVRKDRCITYVYEKKCLVCEEHCPTSPKAIWKRDVTLTGEDGKKVTIGQPRVNPNRCIGCGVCEHVCPVVDQPGIFITSVGETRNPKNEFSLSRQ